jgi:hypothetical protein
MSLLLAFEPILLIMASISVMCLAATTFKIVRNMYNAESDNGETLNIDNELLKLQFDNSEDTNVKRLFLENQKEINKQVVLSGGIGNQQMYHYTNTFGQVMQSIENFNSSVYNNSYSSNRCEYCNTKHTNEEKHCSGCGAPL